MSALRFSPSPSPTHADFSRDDLGNVDFDQSSARSISLSSPRDSVLSRRESRQVTSAHAAQANTPTISEFRSFGTYNSDKRGTIDVVDTESTDAKEAALSPSSSSLSHDETRRSSRTSITTSSVKYPPTHTTIENDAASMISYASSSSRKVRPESKLIETPAGPLVPGIALVDFNHLVGPRIEFCDGALFNDEQLNAILPFLALPDGAHLSSEDYSYFHLVPTSPHPTTIFGISCNRQIKTADLLVKEEDMTRSTVQKAVVVLASKPLFGPIRDRLGVVTQALFSQRDFRETGILVDFKSSLEMSLRTQLTESALYMGTSLRELVHKFRSRTLVLLKSLILQKRIMFYGHPVETLCTYQYSLISLIPGLLQNLDDCGSPLLAARALTLAPATSLKTSDRKSLMAYLGLPLDLFGRDAFFQPYLPLQQVDIIKDTRSYMCGSTNSIVTQQKEIDLLVNIETNTFEFRDPQLERLVALTPADRKWMDDIVRDVNGGWNDGDPNHSSTMQFKGSDDYIRTKFEEYVTAALASVKYADFVAKSSRSDVVITGGADGGDAKSTQDFNPQWIAEFRRTNAFEVWNRITDPMIFDIVEARHPCSGKPGVVEDIGLRLQEGLQDLHIQEQLTPAREAISRTFATGSTNFFKAVEGVRGRWAQRSTSTLSTTSEGSISSTPVEINRSEVDLSKAKWEEAGTQSTRSSLFSNFSQPSVGLRPLSLSNSAPSTTTNPAAAATTNGNNSGGQQSSRASSVAADAKSTIGSWGTSIGSFISQRTTRLSVPRTNSLPSTTPTSAHQIDNNNSTTNSFGVVDKRPETIVESPTGIGHDVDDSVSRVQNGDTAGGTGARSAPAPAAPLSNLFSSWSFGKASASPSKSSPSSTTVPPSSTSPPSTSPPPPLVASALPQSTDALNTSISLPSQQQQQPTAGREGSTVPPQDLGELNPLPSPSVRSTEDIPAGMAV